MVRIGLTSRPGRPAAGVGQPWLLAALVSAVLLAPAGAQEKRPRPTPGELTRSIETRLEGNAAVDAHRIDVTADKRGQVVLSGSVDSMLARRAAVQTALEVKGVRAVQDKLEVRPEARSDEQLREDVAQALADHAATEGLDLSASVEGGVVTLKGSAPTRARGDLAAAVVSGVKGVRSVENEVTVREEERPASEIKAEVERRLRRDASVDDALITVKVDDGQVTLTGTVGSAAEKQQAIADSRVGGVRSVDAEKLEVDRWWDRPALRRKELYTDREDKDLAEDVRGALEDSARVRPSRLGVRVNKGIATLEGAVGSLEGKRAATKEALNVPGVWYVFNLLKVRPATEVPDGKLAGRVKAALGRDPYVGHQEIKVRAVNGMVHLVGEVDSAMERGRAEKVADAVRGVVAVRNSLKVEAAPPRPAPPRVGRDLALRLKIESMLKASPLVDGYDIRVAVADRQAVLTGTVDTWREQEEAMSLALEAGAISVRDRMAIRFRPDYIPPR